MVNASAFKKINVKNIGIDPFSPVVVSINDKYGAVLYRWYNFIVIYHLETERDVNNIQKLVGKQTLKEREKIYNEFKKGKLPRKVKVYKYHKNTYYTTKFNGDKYIPNEEVSLKVWIHSPSNVST